MGYDIQTGLETNETKLVNYSIGGDSYCMEESKARELISNSMVNALLKGPPKPSTNKAN